MPAMLETIKVACRWCKTVHTLTVSSKGYKDWEAGTLIQRAMPELTASQRELLISQTCGECWDKMFKEAE